jgi:hypothetical protein
MDWVLLLECAGVVVTSAAIGIVSSKVTSNRTKGSTAGIVGLLVLGTLVGYAHDRHAASPPAASAPTFRAGTIQPPTSVPTSTTSTSSPPAAIPGTSDPDSQAYKGKVARLVGFPDGYGTIFSLDISGPRVLPEAASSEDVVWFQKISKSTEMGIGFYGAMEVSSEGADSPGGCLDQIQSSAIPDVGSQVELGQTFCAKSDEYIASIKWTKTTSKGVELTIDAWKIP